MLVRGEGGFEPVPFPLAQYLKWHSVKTICWWPYISVMKRSKTKIWKFPEIPNGKKVWMKRPIVEVFPPWFTNKYILINLQNSSTCTYFIFFKYLKHTFFLNVGREYVIADSAKPAKKVNMKWIKNHFLLSEEKMIFSSVTFPPQAGLRLFLLLQSNFTSLECSFFRDLVRLGWLG